MATKLPPPPFTNTYTHRVATTDRPCWMCGKLTTQVLTCGADLDFFFICSNHLKDPGFCHPANLNTTDPKQKATYTLHDRVFSMREQKWRDKQREAGKAKAVANLPSVPANALPPKR